MLRLNRRNKRRMDVKPDPSVFCIIRLPAKAFQRPCLTAAGLLARHVLQHLVVDFLIAHAVPGGFRV
jgi:hypothetical protein